MKIAHVITRLILGGAQENTLLTCEGLHALGHEVTLITGPAIGPEGQLMDRAAACGYRLVVIDQLRREISPLRDWRTLKALRRELAALRPDVMHSHSSKAGILARRAAADVGGMRIVHTIHGQPFHPYQSWWLNRLYIALERRAALHSDAIVGVCQAMADGALAAGIGRPEQYSVVYSGMVAEPFLQRPTGVEEFRRRLGLGDGDVLVTQVARLSELKGHEYIVEAASGVKNPRVHFCFVGDGWLRGQIEAQIKQAGLEDRFHLTGLLPPSEVPTVMHASDIVVHCSLREGLARAIPQAMLAGKPVISYDVDGAREIVVTDETGVLLPPREIAGLRSAIERLAADTALREKLGSAGRDKCREQFDHNNMVRRLEELYVRLMQH